jgi:hypothetical protein
VNDGFILEIESSDCEIGVHPFHLVDQNIVVLRIEKGRVINLFIMFLKNCIIYLFLYNVLIVYCPP